MLGNIFMLLRKINKTSLIEASAITELHPLEICDIESGDRKISKNDLRKLKKLLVVYKIPLSIVYKLEEAQRLAKLSDQEVSIWIISYYSTINYNEYRKNVTTSTKIRKKRYLQHRKNRKLQID